MRIRDSRNHLRRTYSWIVCLCLGVAFIGGVLMDIDHPIHYIWGIGAHGRFAMEAFAVSGAFALLCGLGILISLVCRHR